MDKHSTHILQNGTRISESRVRQARREQADFVRGGLVEAKDWFAQVLRRCIALNG